MNGTIFVCLSFSLFLFSGLSCFPQASEEELMTEFLRRRSSNSHRIVGGRKAKPGEVPYILSVQWNGDHFCGASIVEGPNGGQIAITAAHCVSDEGRVIPTSKLTVTAGALTIDRTCEKEQSGQTLAVREIIVHEGYSDFGFPINDIAILILAGNFEENYYVKPAKLPSINHDDHETEVRVSGWGVTEEEIGLSDHLRLVDLPLLSNDECAEKYSAFFDDEVVIYETNICAGTEEGGQDSCYGDSGGPMVPTNSDEETELTLLGVTSWGVGCGQPDFPGVYTRVSSFVKWINQSSWSVMQAN